MGSTDAAASVIQQVRQSMLAGSALGAQLDAVGNNRDVPRPEDTGDDELYRRVLKVLGWLPKGGALSFYSLLAAVFGSQAQVRLQLGRPWRIYEVNANEVIVEIPVGLVVGSPEQSTYLHGASGYARVSAGPTNVFMADFDLSLSSATTLVGKSIHVETAPGTWTSYTISAYAFSAGVATVTVSASTLPTGGGRFYLEVPGDGVDSYRGDYVATGGVSTTYSTPAGPDTDTLSVVGDVTRGVRPGMVVTISVDAIFSTRVVATVAYSSSTNVTTVTVTTVDVTGGQVQQAFVVAQEVADTPTTPPHDDRVYLTGTALQQIVQFYLDLLVHASGIVVRFEVV